MSATMTDGGQNGEILLVRRLLRAQRANRTGLRVSQAAQQRRTRGHGKVPCPCIIRGREPNQETGRTTIKIPTPLRAYTGGDAEIKVDGTTVGAALGDLVTQHPDLRPHLYNGRELRDFVNLLGSE